MSDTITTRDGSSDPEDPAADRDAYGDHDEIVDDDYDDDGELWIDDAEFVYVPKESGILRKIFVAFMIVVVLGVGVVGYGGYWALGQLRGTGEKGAEVSLSIPAGSNMAQTSVILEEKKVIANATFFRYYAKYKNLNTVKAGEYDKFYENMPIDDVVKRLGESPLPQRFIDINVPEGFTQANVTNRIIATFPDMTSAELAAALFPLKSKYAPFRPDGELNSEGFLFPATYRIEKGDVLDEAKLIDQMTTKFDNVADEVGLDKATEKLLGQAGDNFISPYQALIVASMVEKEAKLDEDRPKVARVIYNRIKNKMRLEIDATTFYCPGLAGKTELTKSDLESDSPWNTRRVSGLPPTPIASPGKKSLEAALNPEPGPWLYYVLADKDGRHFFTDNYSQFQRAVNEARKQGLL